MHHVFCKIAGVIGNFEKKVGFFKEITMSTNERSELTQFQGNSDGKSKCKNFSIYIIKKFVYNKY